MRRGLGLAEGVRGLLLRGPLLRGLLLRGLLLLLRSLLLLQLLHLLAQAAHLLLFSGVGLRPRRQHQRGQQARSNQTQMARSAH